MAGTDNSTVSIVIRVVDDSGAIKNVETKLNELGTAGTATNAKLGGMGSALKEVGSAGAGLPKPLIPPIPPEVPEQLAKMHGNMREVSGTARELGINMGYGMRAFLSQSPAVMGALRAMSGLFIGIAAISIFEQLVEGAVRFYEKWVDLNAALDDYTQKAQQAAETKLFDTASLETTSGLLDQITNQITEIENKRAAGSGEASMGSTGFEDVSQYTAADSQAQADAQTKRDKLSEHQIQMSHQLGEEMLKGQTAADGAMLQGYAKASALERDRLREVTHTYDVRKVDEQALAEKSGHPFDEDAFERQRQVATAGVHQESSGQYAALARTEQQSVIAAQNEAANSHLQGIALIQSQEEQAIDGVLLKFRNAEMSKQGMYATTAALWEKFEAQKLLKLQEEQRLVDQAFAQASQVGDTGMKAIQDEGQNKAAGISREISPEKQVGLRVAYEQETDARVLEAHEKFTEEMLHIDQRADDEMLNGYARIEAAADKLAGSAQAKFTEQYKGANLDNPTVSTAYQQDYQAEQDAETRILQNAQRERAALTERDAEEISKIESEAAKASLPPWLAAQQRIREQYDETAQKAKADLDAQLSYFAELAQRQGALTSEQAAAQAQVWNQYYQTVTAEADRANAEMQKQSEQTRDQLAGQLSSFFDNPAKYMEDRAKKLMMDIVANWVMQLAEAKGPMGSAMAWLFGMGPEMSTSTNPKTALGSIFGQHGSTTPHGAAGMTQGSALTTANTSLTSAGSTLTSAGATLSSAASELSSAAGHIASMTGGAAGGTGSVGSGGAAGIGGTAEAMTMGGLGDLTKSLTPGGPSSLGGGVQPSDLNAAPTGPSGVVGTPPGSQAAGGGVGQILNTVMGLFGGSGGSGGASGGGGGSLGGILGMFGGQDQSTGSGGEGSAGATGEHVVGDETSEGESMSSDSGVSEGGGGGLAGGMGMLSGAMGLFSAWNQGANAKNDMGEATAAFSGAMSGAQMGMMFGPIGMGIGAVGGALIGILGDMFGDHGASQMTKYNQNTVEPAIVKEMTSYTAAEVGYEQAMQDMNSLQSQAMQQAEAWGSGAVGVFRSKVMPEVNVAIQEIARQQQADRSGAITMSAAQYDSGGVISSFGDFSTGPFSGFVHARMGETMMNPVASMVHGPALNAMNRGIDPSSYLPRGSGSGMGGVTSDSGSGAQITISALDGASVDYWLRNGGAQRIQAAVNANVNRYAGKSLG